MENVVLRIIEKTLNLDSMVHRKPSLIAFALVIMIALPATETIGQGLGWNAVPEKGFVFEITNKEAQKLLTRSRPDTIFNGLLHNLIDTFDIAKGWTERPSKGHFILATVTENKIHCEYTSVFPYQVFLLKEYDALSLQVLDLDGNIREDAKVKFRWRRLRIDPATRTYRLENEWFNGDERIVTVEVNGFRSVFNIAKHKVPDWYNDWNHGSGPDFYSYLITDKNKYKPNEKVRFKSYALSHSRSPLRKTLEIWIEHYPNTVKIGHVTPHRPGSFSGEIHLHDSLNLTLDKTYDLVLKERNGRVVSRCDFTYEDYEVHGNKLEVQLKTSHHYHPEKNELSIACVDANGLPLKDARAFVLVKTKSIRETFQPVSSLPDTLLFREINLDPDQPTKLQLPSEIFGATNTTYDVHVAVTNSQNQRMERTVSATHYYSQYELTTNFSGDSIIYAITSNGLPMKDIPAMIKANDNTVGREVELPYKEKINPAVSKVRIETQHGSRDIVVAKLVPRIDILGGIEKDSFNIELINPQLLDVSWYIYQGEVLLEKASGTELNFKSAILNRDQTFYAEILYTFGGVEHLKRREYQFREDRLTVALNIPERTYPGQEVEALVEVSDQLGNPVNGVDLTAMAVTAKLNYWVPDLPYYGSSSSPRSKKAEYSKKDLTKRTATIDLDYRKWERRLRLDTMKYYQFTYPYGKTFTHSVAISDSTQFAPFVMAHGLAKEVLVIEVDRIPVYYSWTNQPQGYSFYVAPIKKHEVTLRLFDRVIIMDSVYFDRGKKTLMSIDLDHLPKGTRIHKMSPVVERYGRRKNIRYAFTQTEISRHSVYISSFERMYREAYLEDGDNFIPLFGRLYPMNTGTVVAGPIIPSRYTYSDQFNLRINYAHTGGFRYSFEENVVYKLSAEKLIPEWLVDRSYRPIGRINDVKITKEKFLERWIEEKPRWHARAIHLADHQMRVRVELPEEKAQSGIGAFVFEDCQTKKLISPCRSYENNFFTIPRGCNNVIVVYNNGTYLKMDNIDLRAFHNVVVDLGKEKISQADSLSWVWLSTPSGNCYNTAPTPSPVKSYSLHYSQATVGNVRGRILDNTNVPLPGVNVVVKGTMIGTVTDLDGQFSLDIHDTHATLVLSFIGYQTHEAEVGPGSAISVTMIEDVKELSEVIVTGYSTSEFKSLTGSVSMLSGAVAGVAIDRADDDSETGVDRVEADSIQQAEQKLYQDLLNLKTIRSNFSDVGFWEPQLVTDRRGQSKFRVKFPDDITRWDATVLAMTRRLQTGVARKSIKSYKPLAAELNVPQFLTKGDSAFFVGKVLNYTNDENITGKVEWKGSTTSFEKGIRFNSFHTDQLLVNATSADSITTSYAFTRDDGYLDGEERTIPVVEQGVIRADGTLSILRNNDEKHIAASSNTNVRVEILDNPIDIYQGEVTYLLNYRYDCNEQLASKLVGLLHHKLLMQYEGKPFRYDKDVNKIISRLLKNQNEEFLWSWWDVSLNTSYWMSSHILRALKQARDAGYKVDLKITNIISKAEYKFEFLNDYSLWDVDLLNALASWGAKLKYAKHVRALDSIVARTEATEKSRWGSYYEPYSSLKEKLLLHEVRQLAGLPHHRDSLLRYRKDGVMGDLHFSDNKKSRYWYSDDLSVNSIAYRIVRRDSSLRELMEPLQMYFLSSRKEGAWNTYHSSNILMSVLPDLISAGASKKSPSRVLLSGKINQAVEKFPLAVDLLPGEGLTVKKEAGVPLFFMQYINERVTVAKTGIKGFSIATTLAQNKPVLEAGKPVTLVVEVTVEKGAKYQYVMIEVPIPGACSYADKRQRDNAIETHREYFKDRTVIFCENMEEGKYAFAIQLLPRFGGRYFVNPAQVSLMYVPVVNANTDLKNVRVSN
jgi:alpha-2-macroglobulin